MDSKTKKSWDENGYILLENILTEDECLKIKKIVQYLAYQEKINNNAHIYDNDPVYTAGHKPRSNQNGSLQRVWNLINKHEIFQEIIQRPIIMDIMEEIFDRDTSHHKFGLKSFQANIIGPGGTEQRLHVDTAIPEPFPSWTIEANTVWLIDDFTEYNGATWYLPGSHKFGTKPKKHDQSRSDLIQLAGLKKGSLAIHSGYLWHKRGENKTLEDRMVLLGAFSASYVRDVCNEEEYLVLTDKDKMMSFSKKLRQLIGFEHGIHRGALETNTKKT